MSSMDETDLTARLARDLDAAFEALVLVEQDLVFGIALRSTGDAAAAEDLAQDAFVRAYRAL
ncbi:MAG: RNA polymerase sigma factor, partial [Candidatus Limnocylindrales bacterium]